MSSDSIRVTPSTAGTSRPVITDLHTAVYWPVYKLAYGDASSTTRVDATNPLPVLVDGTTPIDVAFTTRDPYLEIARGAVSGQSIVNKFGRNIDVDKNTDPEDVWDGGGIWVPPTTARTHDITSSSAEDNAGQTGATAVQVQGLDASYALQEESVTLNGIANVATANTYTMIHRMYVTAALSTGGNVGTITATAQTDGTVTAQIQPTNNQTLMAIYQIPAGKTGYLTSWYMGVNRGLGASANVDFALLAQPDGEVFQIKHFLAASTTVQVVQHRFDGPVKFPAKTTVKVQAVTTSADGANVVGGFDMVLVDD